MFTILYVLFCLLVIAILTWLTFCAFVWMYHFWLGGHKQDKSGDVTLAVLFLPILPFIWLRGKIWK